jgi:hypothetical protein
MKTLCSKLASLRPAKTSAARFLSAAVAATSLSAVTAPAQGGLVRDIANDPLHRDLGASYLVGGSGLSQTGGGTVSFRVLVPGVGTGQRNASAILLNEGWAITAYHNVADLLQFNPTYEIATGSNYLNNRGTVRGIAEMIPYPGGSFNNPNLPDLCLLRLATPLTGTGSVVFGSARVDEALYGTGFGNYGSPAVGQLPRDGNVRGWIAPVQSFMSGSYSATFYRQTQFESDLPYALNGRGMSGDSGGGWYNSQGQLVGMNVAATLGTGPGGQTTYLRFDNSDVHTWISTTIPAPSTALVGLTAMAFAARRRR